MKPSVRPRWPCRDPLSGHERSLHFHGVPGRKGPVTIDTDTIMRDAVLKNQLIFGTVNASMESFAEAIADIGQFQEKWPPRCAL
jgi:hypothetical protein